MWLANGKVFPLVQLTEVVDKLLCNGQHTTVSTAS